MSNRIPVTLLAAMATLTLSAPLMAQARSTAGSAALDAAVVARPADQRAAVTAALTSPQALAAAERLGMNADQVTARVAALDEPAVGQLSDRILAGGNSTVVISTTAIIIGLLILILLT